ncbi:MAG TPA: hypothetical protein VFI49_13210 [Rudaea sp.]|nr:hypothetical protein [Rudaea sp.]
MSGQTVAPAPANRAPYATACAKNADKSGDAWNFCDSLIVASSGERFGDASWPGTAASVMRDGQGRP